MIKKLLSVAMVLSLCFTLMPITASAIGDFLIQNGILFEYHGPGGHVIIPEGVTQIEFRNGRPVFPNSESITELEFPDSLMVLGEVSLFDGAKIENIKLPPKLTSIGWRAFVNCAELKSVAIPENVTFIGNSVFENCTSLKEVTFSGSKEIVIAAWAFANCTNLTSVTLSAGLYEDFDCRVFERCSNLKSINIDPDSKRYCSVDGVLYTKDMTELVAMPPGRTGKFIIPSGVTKIRNNAFTSSALEHVVIPAGVTEIPSEAFSDSAHLQYVDIPEGIIKIDGGAFSDCINLQSLAIPSSVCDIQTGITPRCTSLTDIYVSPENKQYISVDGVLFSKDMTILVMFPCGYEGGYAIPDTVEYIRWSAFDGCKGLTSIAIPNSIRYLDGAVFAGCTGLKEAVIPGSIDTISGIFSGCENLETVIICNGVKKIGFNAFDNCKNLTSVKIPSSVVEIGAHAFDGCESLTEIIFPNNLKTIGNGAFSFCKKLKEIRIPPKVAYIGDCSFLGCEALEQVSMPTKASYLGFDAFASCPITSINIPMGVEEIPIGLFRNCSRLNTVTIPNTVKSIDGSAFQGCIALRNINYEGTSSQWNTIEIDVFNEPLMRATLHFGYERPIGETVSYDVHFSRQNVYHQGQFTDVKVNQWFTDTIASAFELGLMKGNSTRTFNPYGDVTVAEAITMAARIHSINATGKENFVQSKTWWQTYLDYAYQNGIISSAYYNSDVTQKATRAQFAEIFAGSMPDENLYAMNEINDNDVPDVSMNQSYASSIYKLYRAGILTGSDTLGNFNPYTFITRAEAATILSRMADSDNRVEFMIRR